MILWATCVAGIQTQGERKRQTGSDGGRSHASAYGALSLFQGNANKNTWVKHKSML